MGESNRDSIQSRFESQRRSDSTIARFDSSTMRFDTDSIQILMIRFNRHTIWTVISKSWLKFFFVQYSFSSFSLSVRSFLEMFGFTHHWCMPAIIRSVIIRGRLWTARSMHVKALLRKWKFQWLLLPGTNNTEICLLKPFCCFGIWDLIWDLEFEDSRFWCEIRFKIWDLAWRFKSPVKKIWDFRVRFDLRFAHHCSTSKHLRTLQRVCWWCCCW